MEAERGFTFWNNGQRVSPAAHSNMAAGTARYSWFIFMSQYEVSAFTATHKASDKVYVYSVLECNGTVSAYNLHLWGSSDSPATASQVAGITVEMGFHHVEQAGLELLTSDDPPTSASQSAGITGMSHHAWPLTF
ncbi:hypothetical protein AAY473_010865 [Plecturocebus cupreus]